MAIPRVVDAALDRVPADLLLTNGRVLDVLSGELSDADVAITGEHIARVGEARGIHRFDLRGRIVLPGFIDVSAVLETTHLSVSRYGDVALTNGVTTALLDFAGILAVAGSQEVLALLDKVAPQDLDVLFALPLWGGSDERLVPRLFTETSPLTLSFPRLVARRGWLPGKGILSGWGQVLRLPAVDTHLPAFVQSGSCSDEEISALCCLGADVEDGPLSADDALFHLRCGQWVVARAWSGRSPGDFVRTLAQRTRLSRVCIGSGDLDIHQAVDEGLLTGVLKGCIASGCDPVDAIRAVTLNPAELLQLRDRGLIAPGHLADLVVVESLKSLQPYLVVKRGRPVALNGERLHDVTPSATRQGRGVPPLRALSPVHLVVHGHSALCNIVVLTPDGRTELTEQPIHDTDGQLIPSTESDVAKVVVIGRESTDRGAGLGFVMGLGLQRGALCVSFGGLEGHIVACGVDDTSLYTAIRRVATQGGGAVVAENAEVLASVATPGFGFVSDADPTQLAQEFSAVEDACRGLGCELDDPLRAVSTLADVRLPRYRFTTGGLIDVDTGIPLPLRIGD
ncbi:MAG: amidohydrolase family protein [Chloroflexi bacterium]|nr:amidohydrolase family protein [Chloroflexota bacterium]